MNNKELKQAVAKNDSDTYMAYVFRKKFGVEKKTERKQSKRSNHKMFERMMNNRYGCGDRFGK